MQKIISFCSRILLTMMTISAVIVADRFIDVQYFTWPMLGLTMVIALIAVPWELFLTEASVWYR